MKADPTGPTGPTGMYNCSEKDCKVVERYMRELRQAAMTPRTGSLIADPAIGKLTKFLGTMNDGNKVDISLGKLNGVQGATSLANGRIGITLDQSKIGNDARNGAAVLGHEGVHGAQFTARGVPTSLRDVMWRERAANSVKSLISERLNVSTNVWFPGITPEQKKAAIDGESLKSCSILAIGNAPNFREPFPGESCP